MFTLGPPTMKKYTCRQLPQDSGPWAQYFDALLLRIWRNITFYMMQTLYVFRITPVLKMDMVLDISTVSKGTKYSPAYTGCFGTFNVMSCAR